MTFSDIAKQVREYIAKQQGFGYHVNGLSWLAEIAELLAEKEDVRPALDMMREDRDDWRRRAEAAEAKVVELEKMKLPIPDESDWVHRARQCDEWKLRAEKAESQRDEAVEIVNAVYKALRG